MSNTPLLGLPYLMAAQAQKHITHNEALRALDALVQIGVVSRDRTRPPENPVEGERHLVAAGGTGAFAGQDGRVAAFQDGAFAFYAPQPGWLAFVAAEKMLVVFDGNGWAPLPGPRRLDDLEGLGINAAADATNRLIAKSDAVLLTHDDVTPGSGNVRVTINKAQGSNAGALLFQTGYSGRAEIGTVGDDRLRVKVSPDGQGWTSAVTIDGATGALGIGTEPSQYRLELGSGEFSSAAGRFDGPAGRETTLSLLRDASTRWKLGMSADPESGVDRGSDFILHRFTDGGAYLGTPLRIARADGSLAVSGKVRSRDLAPSGDNAYSLGASGARWSSIWSANGVIQTSDERDKTEIAPIAPDVAGRLVDQIAPVTFRWAEGGREPVGPGETTGEPVLVARTGARRHAGFLAQDVRAALLGEGLDIAAWGLDDPDRPESRQWLRPDQMIAVLWSAVRGLRASQAAQGDASG
ncbi:DUF2793 domain-containing protein [Fulvimarina sp. 2208YS6-2-32]|uniref:DUF2793 domain-containing protein n=1 Tax=Fulvimarina uroteuthidis TaxID=3098149 RepID=A0ABU5IA25_9HYPH|nr:DUF2793 domain-containing protein [Fulvimarina sp. 2208YS6-2-32]MDY8111111.1 DUF2793 domain-containing protein [Fulvimarina sp. 2208YS6-2-32]